MNASSSCHPKTEKAEEIFLRTCWSTEGNASTHFFISKEKRKEKTHLVEIVGRVPFLAEFLNLKRDDK